MNQGGVDVTVLGRKDFLANTRVAGAMEYLSSYVYRLVFDDNYSQATSSQVSSEVVLTHDHNGIDAVRSGLTASNPSPAPPMATK